MKTICNPQRILLFGFVILVMCGFSWGNNESDELQFYFKLGSTLDEAKEVPNFSKCKGDSEVYYCIGYNDNFDIKFFVNEHKISSLWAIFKRSDDIKTAQSIYDGLIGKFGTSNKDGPPSDKHFYASGSSRTEIKALCDVVTGGCRVKIWIKPKTTGYLIYYSDMQYNFPVFLNIVHNDLQNAAAGKNKIQKQEKQKIEAKKWGF